MVARIRTTYKRKDKKVNPVDVPLKDGINPGGGLLRLSNSSERETEDVGRQHAGKTAPPGSRLTEERLAAMKIGDGFLTDDEKQLFIDILYEFEEALAFEDSEMGLLDETMEPPVVIHIVPHTPWQQQNLRLPKSMQDIATEHVKEKLSNGMLEPLQGPYRSRYFVVPKSKPGEYRFINDVQPLNKVMIRDAGMPPAVDEFSEDFAGYPIASSMDFYAGYYQIPLAKESRDLTAFMSDLGLVRSTRLPTGWTNSVAVFQRVISKVLWRHIPMRARPFLDGIGVNAEKD